MNGKVKNKTKQKVDWLLIFFKFFVKALLSTTLCQSLYESKTGPLKTGIGFGFGAIQMNDDVVFYHDGDMPSSSTRMMFYPETKVDQSVFFFVYIFVF